MYFRNYRLKNLVRTLSKKRSLRTHFDSQHVKVPQILAKLQGEHFHHVFLIILREVDFEISPLVLGEILGAFVKTLTVDDKYPVQDCENLPLPIQMQFS